jgi:hypothetical protein
MTTAVSTQRWGCKGSYSKSIGICMSPLKKGQWTKLEFLEWEQKKIANNTSTHTYFPIPGPLGEGS